MVKAPVLAFPDFSIPFVVETDACATGIGVVLMQKHKPIAFLSKAIAPKHLGGFLLMKKSSWLWCMLYRNGDTTCWVTGSLLKLIIIT